MLQYPFPDLFRFRWDLGWNIRAHQLAVSQPIGLVRWDFLHIAVVCLCRILPKNGLMTIRMAISFLFDHIISYKLLMLPKSIRSLRLSKSQKVGSLYRMTLICEEFVILLFCSATHYYFLFSFDKSKSLEKFRKRKMTLPQKAQNTDCMALLKNSTINVLRT